MSQEPGAQSGLAEPARGGVVVWGFQNPAGVSGQGRPEAVTEPGTWR